MAAGAPTKESLNLIFLHDVDGTLIPCDDNKLNEPLVEMAAHVQKELTAKGVNVVHHLFTARSVIITLKYLFLAFMKSEDVGKSPVLLTNLVEVLKERGLLFSDTAPVIQVYDGSAKRDLGSSFESEHKVFERLLLSEIGYALLNKLKVDLEKSGVEPKTIYNEIHNRIWNISVAACYSEDKERQKMAEQTLNKYRAGCPEWNLLFNIFLKEVELYAEIGKKETIPTDKKTHALGKVFEDAIKKHGRNFLIIWNDDLIDLYGSALASQIKIGEVLISTLILEHVIFIRNDPYEPKDLKTYLDIIGAAIHTRESLAAYRSFFPYKPESASPLLALAMASAVGVDGPISESLPSDLKQDGKSKDHNLSGK